MILDLLRTRRWLGFTAVVIGTIIAFGLLSAWQWSRADLKREQRVQLEAALAAEPLPLSSLGLPAGSSFPAADEWRPVTVFGTYLADSQTLVRKRPLDGANGFWVMTALSADDGSLVWVNRGWLRAGQDALTTPTVPPAPSVPVTVTGYLRAYEDAAADANTGLPTGMIAAVALPLLPDAAGASAGYVQLSTSTPPQSDLTVLPSPTIDETRNISYAGQWALFAVVAIGGWFFFLRREALEDAQQAAEGE